MSVMNVQGTGLRAHAQLCSATQAVKCAVALSSPSSLASVSLSFLSQFYCPHCRPGSPCCNTVIVHLTRFS